MCLFHRIGSAAIGKVIGLYRDVSPSDRGFAESESPSDREWYRQVTVDKSVYPNGL